ncbi:chorismate mutase [Bacillus sp. 196mf]|uniref:chorismate mutase n=1 Tax=Bacillus sp. 196mf TaxID=1761754 RepID=UPI000D7D0EDC|nr:chorismate mutase [Bacillus sp. 196mf]PYE88353.1 chorismate mutase [Bacillus sp. 196mf]
MNQLKELRKRLDDIDQQILNYLNIRGKIVEEIGKEKMRFNLDINDQTRENFIIKNITAKNKGPYTPKMIEKLYKEIFKISKELQNKDLQKI